MARARRGSRRHPAAFACRAPAHRARARCARTGCSSPGTGGAWKRTPAAARCWRDSPADPAGEGPPPPATRQRGRPASAMPSVCSCRCRWRPSAPAARRAARRASTDFSTWRSPVDTQALAQRERKKWRVKRVPFAKPKFQPTAPSSDTASSAWPRAQIPSAARRHTAWQKPPTISEAGFLPRDAAPTAQKSGRRRSSMVVASCSTVASGRAARRGEGARRTVCPISSESHRVVARAGRAGPTFTSPR